MQTELIVFDWDGTLMDSAGKIVRTMQAAFTLAGAPEVSDSEVRDIIGLALDIAIERLLKVDFGEQSALVQEIMMHYRDLYTCSDGQAPILFDGVVDTLSSLVNSGYFLAVATGKSRRGLTRALAETGVGAYFDTSRCADECFSKPHPQMLHEIGEELGVESCRMIMVGDSEWDILMANNADVRSLGVSYGAHDADRLSQSGAFACLQDISEIFQHVGVMPS